MDDKIIAPLLPLNLHQQTGIFSLGSFSFVLLAFSPLNFHAIAFTLP